MSNVDNLELAKNNKLYLTIIGVLSVAIPVVVAVLFSLIGAYYYLRIIKLMYFDEAVDQSPIVVGRDMQVTLSANGIAIVLLGILPGPLMVACAHAIAQALAS